MLSRRGSRSIISPISDDKLLISGAIRITPFVIYQDTQDAWQHHISIFLSKILPVKDVLSNFWEFLATSFVSLLFDLHKGRSHRGSFSFRSLSLCFQMTQPLVLWFITLLLSVITTLVLKFHNILSYSILQDVLYPFFVH